MVPILDLACTTCETRNKDSIECVVCVCVFWISVTARLEEAPNIRRVLSQMHRDDVGLVALNEKWFFAAHQLILSYKICLKNAGNYCQGGDMPTSSKFCTLNRWMLFFIFIFTTPFGRWLWTLLEHCHLYVIIKGKYVCDLFIVPALTWKIWIFLWHVNTVSVSPEGYLFEYWTLQQFNVVRYLWRLVLLLWSHTSDSLNRYTLGWFMYTWRHAIVRRILTMFMLGVSCVTCRHASNLLTYARVP